MPYRKFPYLQDLKTRFLPEPMPYLPLTLAHQNQQTQGFGLLDTGSTVSVLPYETGLQLGLQWEKQRIPLQLKGNLANFAARAVLLDARIEGFAPVKMAFAWTNAENAPLILGQTNFFLEFEACFCRATGEFEIKRK